MSRTLWANKDPEEKLVASFDFASEIDAGESIQSVLITCTLVSGSDASPASVLNGSPVISGTNVLQPFQGGVDGCTYTLRCAASLSSGRVLVLAATLPVRTA